MTKGLGERVLGRGMLPKGVGRSGGWCSAGPHTLCGFLLNKGAYQHLKRECGEKWQKSKVPFCSLYLIKQENNHWLHLSVLKRLKFV